MDDPGGAQVDCLSGRTKGRPFPADSTFRSRKGQSPRVRAGRPITGETDSAVVFPGPGDPGILTSGTYRLDAQTATQILSIYPVLPLVAQRST